MEPREFFPSMPDEVFDMWLAPFIAEIGWPFTEHNTDTTGTRWVNLLGETPLPQWMSCTWDLVDIDFRKIKISTSSQFALHAVIQFCTAGTHTEAANLANTKDRFRACADFIAANGRIPSPIVAIIRGEEFDIVDGNHRIAALAHVGPPKNYLIPAWVPSFEKPNK